MQKYENILYLSLFSHIYCLPLLAEHSCQLLLLWKIILIFLNTGGKRVLMAFMPNSMKIMLTNKEL